MTLFQQMGDIKPKSHRHGPPKLMADHEQLLLLRLILSYPGICLHEIQTKLTTTLGVTVSPATICRTLKFMGCTRQVLQHIALQQVEEQRVRFMAEVSVYDPLMLLWIDESGCDRCHSMRKRAYAIRGKPPRDHKILSRGIRYSAVPIMPLEGVHDICLLEGSVSGEKFEEFIRSCLLPILHPFNGVN